MVDELVSALLKDAGLRILVCTSGNLAREARRLHSAEPASAAFLAQGLTAALLMGGLQKEKKARVNLQLECDGPLHGLFVDGNAGGQVRGYVKNPGLVVSGSQGTFEWRPLLGNSGFLSVLRELGVGEYYRSSVELEAFDLSLDLERYFRASEQIDTWIRLEVLADDSEGLAQVVGILVQPLPDGDREAFRDITQRLSDRSMLRQLLVEKREASAAAVMTTLFPQPSLEVMSRYPVEHRCKCSKDRVTTALLAMGRAEIEDVLAKEGKAELTCQFCMTHYVISGDEITALLAEQDSKKTE